MTTAWNNVREGLPERGRKIDWIGPSGQQVDNGTYQGVWMLPGGMYVYYEPVFWRYSQ